MLTDSHGLFIAWQACQGFCDPSRVRALGHIQRASPLFEASGSIPHAFHVKSLLERGCRAYTEYSTDFIPAVLTPLELLINPVLKPWLDHVPLLFILSFLAT